MPAKNPDQVGKYRALDQKSAADALRAPANLDREPILSAARNYAQACDRPGGSARDQAVRFCRLKILTDVVAMEANGPLYVRTTKKFHTDALSLVGVEESAPNETPCIVTGVYSDRHGNLFLPANPKAMDDGGEEILFRRTDVPIKRILPDRAHLGWAVLVLGKAELSCATHVYDRLATRFGKTDPVPLAFEPVVRGTAAPGVHFDDDFVAIHAPLGHLVGIRECLRDEAANRLERWGLLPEQEKARCDPRTLARWLMNASFSAKDIELARKYL